MSRHKWALVILAVAILALVLTLPWLTTRAGITLGPTPEKVTSPTPPAAGEIGPVVWASSKSDKYHDPSCLWAQRIKPENRVVFRCAPEAWAMGYDPCKTCRPPG